MQPIPFQNSVDSKEYPKGMKLSGGGKREFSPNDVVHELKGTRRNRLQIFDSNVCISFKTVFDFLVCYERNLNSSPTPKFSDSSSVANDML